MLENFMQLKVKHIKHEKIASTHLVNFGPFRLIIMFIEVHLSIEGNEYHSSGLTIKQDMINNLKLTMSFYIKPNKH